jgi:kumamolisin
LAEKFGASKKDADKVAKSLKKFGLKVDSVSLATRSMSVSGTAAAMEAAFKPDLAMMRAPDQGEYRGRVMMDMQIIAGLCPKAEISVYFSTFDQGGWVDLLNAVIIAKPAVLSVSWGLAEDDSGWSANAVAAINDRLNAARLLGITTCVSSGDDGSGDQIDDGGAHVDFPACSPFALGVGGTMLTRSGANVKEVTWWEAPGRRTNAGGGGDRRWREHAFPPPELAERSSQIAQFGQHRRPGGARCGSAGGSAVL